MAEKEGKSTKKTAEFFKGAGDVLETAGYSAWAVEGAVASAWNKKGFIESIGAGLSFWFLGTLAREMAQEFLFGK